MILTNVLSQFFIVKCFSKSLLVRKLVTEQANSLVKYLTGIQGVLLARHRVFKVRQHFQAFKGRVVLKCNQKKTDLCDALGSPSFFCSSWLRIKFSFSLCLQKASLCSGTIEGICENKRGPPGAN